MILLKLLQKKIIASFLVLTSTFCSNILLAQELNCTVSLNYEQVNNVNQSVFETMENAIREFINNQRWTNDEFKIEEKINVNILINISSAPSQTSFKSTISIQANRPIFESTYETVLFNFIDKNGDFVYQPDQPLYFVENSYTSNLTSMLAFYAYIILGHDYDSFSDLGGSKYYEKAQEIASYAQQATGIGSGWNRDDKRSRFEMIQDLTNNQFVSYRKNVYLYNRLSLDIFTKEPNKVRTNILKILDDHNKIFDVNPNSLLLRIFFMSKVQELINIFSKATPTEKQTFLKLVEKLDPSNLNRYQKIN